MSHLQKGATESRQSTERERAPTQPSPKEKGSNSFLPQQGAGRAGARRKSVERSERDSGFCMLMIESYASWYATSIKERI